METNSDIFLEHFGVKGMKWGVRRTNTRLQVQAVRTDKRTTQGKQIKKMASESKRIADAGGGLKGTLKVRREMIKSGELSKETARAGNIRIGAGLAAGILAGSAAGLTVGKMVKDSL